MPKHEKTKTQLLFDQIQKVKKAVLLDYAIIGLMDNDDFGQGSLMQFQTINSQEVEQKHLNHIKTDVQTYSLQNKVVENAVVIGVHSGYVDKSLLHPMTHSSYNRRVKSVLWCSTMATIVGTTCTSIAPRQ